MASVVVDIPVDHFWQKCTVGLALLKAQFLQTDFKLGDVIGGMVLRIPL